jgi:hypothetical protein
VTVVRAELADAGRELDRILDGLARLAGLAGGVASAEPGPGGAAEAAVLAAFGYQAGAPIPAAERSDLLQMAGSLDTEPWAAAPGALLALLAGDRNGEGELAAGAIGLRARLLRARWWQLGLADRPPSGAPWRPEELAAVRGRLAQALGDASLSDGDALQIASRPLELLNRLMRRDPHGYVVLDSTGKGASAFEGLRVDDAGEFDQRVLPYLVQAADGPRIPDLRACRDSAGNRLALRALQLRLWRLGLIDGPVSDATDYARPTSDSDRQRLAGLGQALELVAGQSDDGQWILRREVGKDYMAVNLHLLAPRLAGLTGPAVDALLAEAATASIPSGMALQRVVGAARWAHVRLAEARSAFREVLLGEPLGSARLAARWTADGDVVLLASPDVSADDVASFVAEVRGVCQHLEVALAVAVLAIDLVQSGTLVLAGPAGWAAAALRLAGDIGRLGAAARMAGA